MTRWQQELEKVRLSHNGRLHPKHVVAAAKNRNNPLHSHFEWDDTKAGAAYRLQQAAELIREVTFLPSGATEPVRAYVSLSSDRLSKTGYRAVVDVLSDAQQKAQWVEDARNELLAFTTRYDCIRNVASFRPVRRAIERFTKAEARV